MPNQKVRDEFMDSVAKLDEGQLKEQMRLLLTSNPDLLLADEMAPPPPPAVEEQPTEGTSVEEEAAEMEAEGGDYGVETAVERLKWLVDLGVGGYKLDTDSIIRQFIATQPTQQEAKAAYDMVNIVTASANSAALNAARKLAMPVQAQPVRRAPARVVQTTAPKRAAPQVARSGSTWLEELRASRPKR